MADDEAKAAHAGDIDPIDRWRQLRESKGRRATIIDLYGLVAASRGIEAHELPVAERLALARAVMPIVWPGFSVTDGSERQDALEVVAYESTWPSRFEVWRQRIATRLGAAARRIEHVGSTSVPGLAAKPIIDLQISVTALEDESLYVEALERAGLQLRSRDDLHRYFRPFAGRPREVHVHVCASGSSWEREHLLFRDYLREHPRARDSYGEAKWAAVRLWSDDGWAYTDAKSDVVLDILEQAEEWATEVAWVP